jgi:t-SNARE complex subunit (syntaxin)
MGVREQKRLNTTALGYRTMDKTKNPVIPSGIHHRQKALESTRVDKISTSWLIIIIIIIAIVNHI